MSVSQTWRKTNLSWLKKNQFILGFRMAIDKDTQGCNLKSFAILKLTTASKTARDGRSGEWDQLAKTPKPPEGQLDGPWSNSGWRESYATDGTSQLLLALMDTVVCKHAKSNKWRYVPHILPSVYPHIRTDAWPHTSYEVMLGQRLWTQVLLSLKHKACLCMSGNNSIRTAKTESLSQWTRSTLKTYLMV